MMINIKKKKRFSANTATSVQKSIYHDHKILSLNNRAICAQDVTSTRSCNNKGIVSETACYFFNLTLTSTYKSLAEYSKLIRTYHIFLFQFALALANDSSSSQQGNFPQFDQLKSMQQFMQVGENVHSFVGKISSSCQNMFGPDSFVCNNPHYAISLFFFLISTFFSILFGLLNRVLKNVA